MEPNETYDQTSPMQELVLNAEAQIYLRESGKWAVFLGIVGFVLTGFYFWLPFLSAPFFH
jgi:hypothetical protein